ncbi:hypothetical protein F4818DRAFT_421696 [Hypoxylon cercidicola]|nr:hypothetical protein F4818DRAFT_421696 [Hypoxylon cercidicola]
MSGHHNYDKNTGQTFKEWLVRPSKPDQVEWFRIPAEVPPYKEPYPRKKGVSSLVDIAIRVVARNLSLLEVDDLEHVPTTLMCRIWEYLAKRNSMSLQSFKIIARYVTKELREHRKSKSIDVDLYKSYYDVPCTTGPLSTYTSPLISTSFDFIVHLTLAGHHASFDTHQLLTLTELKNLGVLEILQPLPSSTGTDGFPRMTDAIIRQWSEEPDPFPMLRVMRIWGDHFTTVHSLQYLSKFPALAVYDVAGLERDWGKIPQVPGWTYKRRAWRPEGILQILHNCISLLRPDVVYHPDWHIDVGILESWSQFAGIMDPKPEEIADSITDSRLEEITVSILDRDDIPKPHIHVDNSLKQSSSKKKETIFTRWRTLIGQLEGSIELQFWGYLLYCHIGQLRSDEDLVAQGIIQDASQAFFVRPFQVIPPRPYVTLQLGKCCRNSRQWDSVWSERRPCCNHGTERTFEEYHTFARPEYHPKGHETPSASDVQGSNSAKRHQESSSLPRLRKKPKAFPTEDIMR